MLRILVLLVSCFAVWMPSFAKIKVSVIPYKITGAQDFTTLERGITEGIKSTLEQSPDLIVFPELMSFELLPGLDGQALIAKLKEDAHQFDAYLELIKAQATKHNVAILGGTFQRIVEGKVYNTAIFAHADGTITLQDKLFVTPWEGKQGWSNGTALNVIDFNGVKMVILTCHDAEFPLLSQKLSQIKPELILVPSMTDDDHGHARVLRTSMARAIEHMAYVVVAGTTSLEGAPWHTYVGNAAFLTPQSYLFNNLEKHSQVGVDAASHFELDFDLLRQARETRSQVYPARDQNEREDVIEVVKP